MKYWALVWKDGFSISDHSKKVLEEYAKECTGKYELIELKKEKADPNKKILKLYTLIEDEKVIWASKENPWKDKNMRSKVIELEGNYGK